MKRTSRLLFCLVLPVLLLSACDIIGSAKEAVEGATGSMRATIDGASWSALSARSTSVNMMGMSNIVIAGANAEGETITITLYGVRANGEYTFNSDKADAQWAPESAAEFYNASSGSVKITSISDDRVEGTFTFDGEGQNGTVSVTDGEFKAPFAEAPAR